MRTVQAAHWPSPQPYLVPVRSRSSRRTLRRVRSASASMRRVAPFTWTSVTRGMTSLSYLSPLLAHLDHHLGGRVCEQTLTVLFAVDLDRARLKATNRLAHAWRQPDLRQQFVDTHAAVGANALGQIDRLDLRRHFLTPHHGVEHLGGAIGLVLRVEVG